MRADCPLDYPSQMELFDLKNKTKNGSHTAISEPALSAQAKSMCLCVKSKTVLSNIFSLFKNIS